MAIIRAQARRLCTEKEFELVNDSYHDRLGHLTLVQARNKARRARKLLEQWQALAKKQRGGSKTTNAAAKRGEESPRRVAKKIELFQQATDRFEQRVAELEAMRRKPDLGAALSEKKKQGPLARFFAKREADKAKRMEAQSRASKATRTQMQEQRSRERAIWGHLAVMTRQEQGKRDSRPDSH